jgi:hypothetical protein
VDTSAAWPKEVRRTAESVRAVGLTPEVSGEPGGDWLVRVEGEHVRATAAFAHRSGRTRQVDGELTIDGEVHPPVGSMDVLRTAHPQVVTMDIWITMGAFGLESDV